MKTHDAHIHLPLNKGLASQPPHYEESTHSWMDKLFAIVLIVLLSPFLLLGMAMVLFEDGFPLIFKQIRVGKYDKDFFIYKIRTMKRETPQLSTNELENPADYRLKSGRLLRKYSIDELPNLWNIVKGDMNFIGPRPLMRREKELHALRMKYHILTQRPGITGWAQINGRDIISIPKKVVLERYYLRNKSFRLKAYILYRTVIIVLRAAGVKF